MTTPRGTGRSAPARTLRPACLTTTSAIPRPARPSRPGSCPTSGGAEFLITFFQPAVLDDDKFDRRAGLIDTELAKLKDILESQPPIVA